MVLLGQVDKCRSEEREGKEVKRMNIPALSDCFLLSFAKHHSDVNIVFSTFSFSQFDSIVWLLVIARWLPRLHL